MLRVAARRLPVSLPRAHAAPRRAFAAAPIPPKYKDSRFTPTHEFLSPVTGKPNVFKLGITQYAAEALGDLVHVELPDVGKAFGKGDVVASVESTKAVGSVYAPAALKVVAVNKALPGNPAKISEDAMEAWLCEAEVAKPDELKALLNTAQYQKHLESEAK